MPTRSIWPITKQKVLKTQTFKSMKQHYLGINKVCGTLNLQSDLVKLEFTVKFDPSLLILLCDDASFASMLRQNDVYCWVYVSLTKRLAFNYPKPLM